ncbi:MAG: hypothetical protein PWQ17_1456 [Anaerophaga sp.]|nr:hypothetical protein [Anaerophaga sp.]
MKRIIFSLIILIPLVGFSQKSADSTAVFKKRVLESTELSVLTSYYTQDGENAAVTGGIGTEELTDLATDISVSIPLNEDDVLSISATVSAYTSASSSNLNPWSGASRGDEDDDEHDGYDDENYGSGMNTGTPWAASSGASKKDVWSSFNVEYNHSSDDRNTIFSGNASFANEYDYTSIGAGAGLVKLFNEKNTEIGINASVFLDTWRPEYPTEIKTYVSNNGDLNADFFQGTDILNQNGNVIDKTATDAWKPLNNTLVDDKSRNTFALSLNFSQILSKTTQISIILNPTYQTGWLANPMQRVYFADKSNFYIGDASDISNYTNPRNQGVFQLADDIERLPDSRYKFPIGIRLNQYISENIVLRSFYRYYFDDWGLQSNTFNAELAIKLGQKFTLYPNYRFYNQTAIDYFAPFDQHLSTSQYYTSDYDLSKYNANQFGMGVKYTDIFTNSHIWKFGIKELTLDYNYYERNTGLKANIVSFGVNFVLD